MMTLAVVFAVIMAIIGWYSIVRVGAQGPALAIGVFGSAATALALWGWVRDSLYLVAAGALGAGLLFPTTYGLVPIVAGFILFFLLISLRLFITTFDE